MPITSIFIDLDGTLYSNDCGLWQEIRKRISAYMQEAMGFSPDEESQLRAHYLQTYGTTLRGLQIHHHVDPEEYLTYVHNVPLEKYLSPDPGLRDILNNLPQSKWVFTNADYNHAWRVMTTLDVQNCFTGIIDIRALDFTCKPQIEAYQKALILAGGPDPSNCLLVDDTLLNLAPAHDLGFYTILVKQNNIEFTSNNPLAYPQINSLHEILGVKPDLINQSP